MGHISTFSDFTVDNNVRMILPPSSDGVALYCLHIYRKCRSKRSSLVWLLTAELTSQAALTITTTDTDIRAGEAVDIEHRK